MRARLEGVCASRMGARYAGGKLQLQLPGEMYGRPDFFCVSPGRRGRNSAL